jgi:hypothetical protein
VTYITRGKGTRLESNEGVNTDDSELACELQSNGLVGIGSTCRRWVLVLVERGDFGVDSILDAYNASLAYFTSVSLNCLVDEGTSHATDITNILGVGESEICGELFETVKIDILEIGDARGGGSVSEKSEDGVRQLELVVKVDKLPDNVEESVVQMLLGNLTLDLAERAVGDR